jgi:hypothetical protein
MTCNKFGLNLETVFSYTSARIEDSVPSFAAIQPPFISIHGTIGQKYFIHLKIRRRFYIFTTGPM